MPPTAELSILTHGSAKLRTGVRLHYLTAGEGPQTVVLVHGYPETWWSWRYIIGPLADAGFRVIAVDYRGAGQSSKPPHGYDKRTMARDIAELLSEVLHIKRPVTLVGNDIGMMVAYAFGSEFPDRVERLLLMEAIVPGTAAYNRALNTAAISGHPMWHFFFHNAGDDLAEALTAGRERLYLRHFYDRHAFNPDAIGLADLDRYTEAYSAAGAMHAGFEIYRAFDEDAVTNREALARNGRLRMPVLALGGEESFFPAIAAEMIGELAENVSVAAIPRCGHWIPEEAPEILLKHLLHFIRNS